jgi:hypothetical protein
MRSLKEIATAFLSHFPPGLVSRLGPTIRKILDGIADAFRVEASNRIDDYRRETNPATCRTLLESWEAALDLSSTKIAQFGTEARRQAQVISVMRALGDLSLPGMRQALEPFLDYADPSQILIIEPDRAALQAAHTYPPASPALPATIPTTFPPLIVFFDILDDGPIGDAGAQIFVNITGNASLITFTLTGPAGTSQQCFFDVGYLGDGAVLAKDYVLYAPPSKVGANGTQSVRGFTKGRWVLTCLNRGIPMATLHSASLFIEANGRNELGQEALGNELHSFVVIADPALLGPLADLEAAADAIIRQKPAYTGGALVVKNMVMGGGILAIPDLPETLPDASIPG